MKPDWTIIVAEDDVGLNRIICRRLEKSGYQTVSALTGAGAVARTLEHEHTLLLLDYVLPDMNAEDVVRALAEHGRAQPFIVVTGLGEETVAAAMMKLGAGDYLVKSPDLIKRLPGVVGRVLDAIETEDLIGNGGEGEPPPRSLAKILEQDGHVYVTGIARGNRTFLNESEVTPGRPAECHDGDYVCLWPPGMIPSVVVSESPSPRTPDDEWFESRRRIQVELLERVNQHKSRFDGMSDAEFRTKVREIITSLVSESSTRLPSGWTKDRILAELLNDFLGLGPIEKLLADDTVSEIMVNRYDQIYVERHGKLELTRERFLDNAQISATILRIIRPLGRRIDESMPYVDARLADGSRVHAIIPPLALNGPKLTIRKFSKSKMTTDDLCEIATLSRQMARFLELMVKYRANIIISGGSGSGKTTLLNVLSNFIPDDQRIVTVEDAAELSINKRDVIALEARPPNVEGTGAVSIRELVRNTLRMRPDRIVVGECRGGEALDMLQAMNTGHDGSLTTIHANSPWDALSRLETLALMAGVDLPSRAIREQIASAINFVVHTARMSDGSRKITHITEISGLEEHSVFTTQDIYVFKQQGVNAVARTVGEFQPTGTIPRFVERLRARGIKIPMGMFAKNAALSGANSPET